MKNSTLYALIAVAMIAVFGMAIADRTKVDPKHLQFEIAGDRAFGNGYTDGQTNRGALKTLDKNPQVKTLVLQNMPGTQDSLANMRLARAFRKRGIATHLQSDSYIASGAVDLFLSGTQRTLECGARIGVHSWGNDFGYSARDLKRDDMQSLHEDFLSDMGINPAFYAFTRAAAPPEQIYILTMADIRRFDLLTTYPNCSVASE